MSAKAERQALMFLAAVALLGAGTRAIRSRRTATDSPDLARQITAVESSRSHDRRRSASSRKAAKSKGRSSGDGDTAGPPRPSHEPVRAPERLDLDRASESEIERLPGIGPAIAKRIVAERDARGAFGCTRALDAVKGIGPAMLRRLDTLVVFSGAPRSGCGPG